MKEAVPSQFTDIVGRRWGKDGWRKMAVSGREKNMFSHEKWNQKLDQDVWGSSVLSNKCEIGEDCAYFEYLNRENLAEYLDLLEREKSEKAEKIFTEYLENVQKLHSKKPFTNN